MTTADFIKAFAKTYNVAIPAADQWVRSIFEFLREQCGMNEEIKIAGFGNFRQNYTPARSYVDFKTGQTMTSEPHMALSFAMAPKLERIMREVPVPKEPPKRGGRKSELPVRAPAGEREKHGPEDTVQ